jgi:hypothetical protein
MSATARAWLVSGAALVAGVMGLVLVPTAPAATVVHFQRESLPALEGQLSKHEVHALSLHPAPAPGHVHVSLQNGQHMTVVYAPAQQAPLLAHASAAGVPVAIAVAKAKTSKSSHHKLRYIAAGLVIVVIAIVTAVLLVDRRRRVNEADGSASAPASSPDAG